MATSPPPNPLVFIRLALWMGIVAFGGVAWFMHQRGAFPVSSQPSPLRYAQVAIAVAAIVLVLVLRGRAARAPDGVERNSQVLRLWAVGEAPALFGGVLYLLTNEAQWYALGLLVMLTTFVLVPIRRTD